VKEKKLHDFFRIEWPFFSEEIMRHDTEAELPGSGDDDDDDDDDADDDNNKCLIISSAKNAYFFLKKKMRHASFFPQ